MRPLVSLRRAFEDDNLLGRVIGGESRKPMRALLLASQGEALDAEEAEYFCALTGREASPTSRCDELHIVAGRRSGKSSGCAALAVYLSCLCEYRDRLATGERGIVLLLAENQRQARVLFDYIVGVLRAAPALGKLVSNQTATTISLSNGIDIEVRAADFRSVRGLTLIACLCDETPFWRSDNSANPDTEIIEAVRPGLVTARGQLISLGSPYSRRGFVWNTFQRYFGKENQRILVAKGMTRLFNPTVPQAFIDAAFERDPLSAAAEWNAEFRSDVDAFVSPEVVDMCIVAGRHEIPYFSGSDYHAFVDPSGGSSDSFTLAIATSRPSDDGSEEYQIGVLCCLREYRPPFSPDTVVADIARTMRYYDLDSLTGDRYGGEWVIERFREHGVSYEPSERPKNDIYRNTLSLLNSGRVELLDNKRLFTQLCSLERRVARGGRDSIDHPPGGHDDLANAALGALELVAGKRSSSWIWRHL